MGDMLERTRIVALACAALASAGCPSLDALECHDAGCEDAGTTVDGPGPESAPPSTTIFCGGSARCTPATGQECCLATSGATSCVSTTMCGNGSDIFCDDPSQCPGGGTCWICVNGQGFQGTSCDYQSDIVNNDHCDQTTALPLCHSSSQCEGGDTCKPLFVQGFDAGAGASWFQACQP